MSASLFAAQRVLGDELLAVGWHSSSIANPAQPGSAWVLFDSFRRVRVHMRADLATVLAEVTASHLSVSPHDRPRWRLIIHHAPPAVAFAAIAAAPHTGDGRTVRDRHITIRALYAAGLRCDRSRLLRTLSGSAVWASPGPDRAAAAVWTTPTRTSPGGWTITGPRLHLEATVDTPAAVLAPLIAATAPATEAAP